MYSIIRKLSLWIRYNVYYTKYFEIDDYGNHIGDVTQYADKRFLKVFEYFGKLLCLKNSTRFLKLHREPIDTAYIAEAKLKNTTSDTHVAFRWPKAAKRRRKGWRKRELAHGVVLRGGIKRPRYTTGTRTETSLRDNGTPRAPINHRTIMQLETAGSPSFRKLGQRLATNCSDYCRIFLSRILESFAFSPFIVASFFYFPHSVAFLCTSFILTR